MKLNLHIILDSLDHYQPIPCLGEGIDLSLEKIRILDKTIESNCLYLTDLNTLLTHPDVKAIQNVIVLGSPDDRLESLETMNIIFIPLPCQMLELYAFVLDLQDQYYRWHLQLMDSIIHQKGLQDLLDTGSTMLKNPIALFDPSFALMLMSGQLPENYDGTIWEDVINTGYAPFDKVSVSEQRRAHQVLEAMTEQPFFSSIRKATPTPKSWPV
jgi:hypothetical protein